MKKIFLFSTLIISSFGMMNLQSLSAAPQQTTTPTTPEVGAKAKALVKKIHQAVALQGNQFSTINAVCIDYFKGLEALNKAKPADIDAKAATLKTTRDQKIKALLTADQLRGWANFKE